MRAGERIPNKSCQIHPAICPTLPVFATLLPGAESRVWTTAVHDKSRIHLTPAAFARVSHSCTRHSRRGGHNMGNWRTFRPKVRMPGRVSSLLLDDEGSHTHPQPKGRIPPTRLMTADTPWVLMSSLKRSWW